MKAQLRILTDDNREDVLYVSKSIYDFLELSENVSYRFCLGKAKNDVTIQPVDDNHKNNIIQLDLRAFDLILDENELKDFENMVLNIWKKDNNICLGPVLGIFVNPRRYSYYNNNTADPVHLKAGIKKGFLSYLFSIDGIDWQKKRIHGITFVPELNKWTEVFLPMPDVVYDRGVRYGKNKKDKVKKMREKFRDDLNIQFINNLDYIGKWKTYKRLLNYDSTAEYLPYTMRYKSFNDILILLRMLRPHSFIFLKSYYGTEGKQVMSIKKHESRNTYILGYYSRGLKEVEVNKIEELKMHVEKFIKDRKFIIQRGVKLLRYEDRPFDLRVLLIKDSEGKWNVVSNYVRVALERDQTITNYSISSQRIYYNKIYPYLSTSKNESIPGSSDIESAAKTIAFYLDKELGSFGELGLDLAIDIYGKLWLLEANTKPSKGLERDYKNKNNEISSMYTAVFDYAKYLMYSISRENDFTRSSTQTMI